MLFRPVKAAVPRLNPEFERFREAVAEAFFGGEQAGFFSVRIDVWFTESSPWWRRRWIDPSWGVEWIFHFDPGFDERHPREGPPFEDGVEIGDETVFDELLAASVDVRGRQYSLRWVDRSADPELWAARYGFVPESRPRASPA